MVPSKASLRRLLINIRRFLCRSQANVNVMLRAFLELLAILQFLSTCSDCSDTVKLSNKGVDTKEEKWRSGVLNVTCNGCCPLKIARPSIRTRFSLSRFLALSRSQFIEALRTCHLACHQADFTGRNQE